MSSALERTTADPAWVQQLVHEATELRLAEDHAAQVLSQAERKLCDLLEVAKETALANGRTVIFWHDLPLTRGMRSTILEYSRFEQSVPAQAIDAYLRDVGILAQVDEWARDRLPRVFVALLVLAGRVIATLTPMGATAAEKVAWLMRTEADVPTEGEIRRAERILNLTL